MDKVRIGCLTENKQSANNTYTHNCKEGYSLFLAYGLGLFSFFCPWLKIKIVR